jgi:excisionase family DNA binding protein
MSYTLGEAAKATGKSKPTIQRAIKSGSISATKRDDGSYLIEPSELHRVFPPLSRASNVTGTVKQSETPHETGVLQREIELLRERLDDKDNVIEDLRRRLDTEAEERRKLTALLTDQRTKTDLAQPQPSLWSRLFSRR